jgi:hypothetical protein
MRPNPASYAMVPTKEIPCKFFARGICTYGESCSFIHEQTTTIYKQVRPAIDIENLYISPKIVNNLNGGTKPTPNLSVLYARIMQED